MSQCGAEWRGWWSHELLCCLRDPCFEVPPPGSNGGASGPRTEERIPEQKNLTSDSLFDRSMSNRNLSSYLCVTELSSLVLRRQKTYDMIAQRTKQESIDTLVEKGIQQRIHISLYMLLSHSGVMARLTGHISRNVPNQIFHDSIWDICRKYM